MKIKLINSGLSAAMERHYQKLVESGWGANVSKETRTFKSELNPRWDTEETVYWLTLNPEIESDLLFNLSDVLQQELILSTDDGQPVIEIYDYWRE